MKSPLGADNTRGDGQADACGLQSQCTHTSSFDTQSVAAALDPVTDGPVRVLKLTGKLRPHSILVPAHQAGRQQRGWPRHICAARRQFGRE